MYGRGMKGKVLTDMEWTGVDWSQWSTFWVFFFFFDGCATV